ncbi:MAG TPA: ABC transporter substrate-binding protein [Devosiaceae bacterium]|jgi:peptide/nickel transport system substrate-binding protein
MHNLNKIVSRGAGALCLSGLALLAASPVLAQATDKSITIVVQSEPDTLDGCQAARSATGTIIMENVVETLDERDSNTGELKPRLATSWEQINDKTWRFHLRTGVKFHDGADWNAAAAVKSINRAMTESLSCEVRLKLFSGLKITATAVDDATLDISADKPVPIMPVQVAALPFTSPNTPDDKIVATPIGTGPYKLAKWDAGQEIDLARNDAYWGDKPAVDGARYVWRGESSVRASMVQLGEADIAPTIAAQDATDAGMDKSYLNSETTYLRIDTLTPPLNDVRVRLALNYAFDRNSVLGSMMPKDALNATQIVVPAIPGHNPELDKEVRAYDPDKAKQLLAEAKADGVPVDTEIVLQARPAVYPNSMDLAQAIVAMYQAVGLNIRIDTIDEATSRKVSNKPFKDGREPALLQATSDNNQGDPVFQASFKYGCEGAQSQLCDPAADALAADASATPAGSARVQKWQQFFTQLYEKDVPEVWMYHMVAYARVGSRVNFTPSLTTNGQLQLAQVSFK